MEGGANEDVDADAEAGGDVEAGARAEADGDVEADAGAGGGVDADADAGTPADAVVSTEPATLRVGVSGDGTGSTPSAPRQPAGAAAARCTERARCSMVRSRSRST